MTTFPMTYSTEVATARDAGTPIVALESTIITHGMPYPQNLEVAQQVEADVRAAGATPATIAVIEGALHIGLDPNQLIALAQAKRVAKLSRADMAVCIATDGTGATTVAATMIAAHLAGIAVFATGGIGGVHKGAEDSFDISADLLELAQTPVTVVAAGAKAILDVAKTLEVLETQGVPVIAFGKTAFRVLVRLIAVGRPFKARHAIADCPRASDPRGDGVAGGQLVANPIPHEAEIPAAELAPVIARAQDDANAHGITGKSVTPYLLQRIFELTEGRSLIANIALVRNNATLAAQIASTWPISLEASIGGTDHS